MPTITPDSRNLINSRTSLKPEGSTTKDPSKPIGPHRGDGPLSVPSEPKRPKPPVMRGGRRD